MPRKTPKSPTADKVIFRFWDGEVIAIFPEIASTQDYYHCQSYQHMGQHASCDPNMIVRCSRPATSAEYRALARELRQRGYKLKIIQRLRSNTVDIRRYQVRQQQFGSW